MENLPILKEDNMMNRIIPKVKHNLGRTGKIIGMGALAVASAAGIAYSPLFFIPYMGTAFNALHNMIFDKQKDIMFITMKKKNVTHIYQDSTRFDLRWKMKDMNPAEKGGVMMLQTMVGFSRIQQELENKKSKLLMHEVEGKQGILAYPQLFQTETHGLNIKNFQALENLGYIKIVNDGKEDKRKLSLSKKVYKRYALSKSNDPEKVEQYFKEKRSLLLLEKYGFGTLGKEDIQGSITDFLTGNIEGLQSRSKAIRTVTFQLTDKNINFEDLYEKVNTLPEDLSFKEQSALRRLKIIFDKQRGILKTANVNIERDQYGIYRINYGTKSFVDRREENDRIDKSIGEKNTTQRESFVAEQTKGAPSLEEQAKFAQIRSNLEEKNDEQADSKVSNHEIEVSQEGQEH